MSASIQLSIQGQLSVDRPATEFYNAGSGKVDPKINRYNSTKICRICLKFYTCELGNTPCACVKDQQHTCQQGNSALQFVFFIWLLRAATGMKVDNPLDCFGHCCNRHMELLKYSAGRYVQQDGHATKLKMRLNIF